MVHGYASKPDCASFVNIFHVQLLGLQSRCYFEWVASGANIADWPTRADKMHLIPASAIKVPLVLPAPWDWESSLELWLDKVKIAAKTYGA